jgi:dephospho-CoA kinase
LTRDPQRGEDQVRQIIQKQLPDKVKNGLADYIIKNYNHHMVIPQVLKIHKELTSLAR